MSVRSIPALQVTGAKTQRGYVVVASEAGIEIDLPQVENLREVHTASVPIRVAQAQYAYRFREADWTIGLMARRRPAEVRAEVFHLQSIGEALAYGSAVVNYLITGSPVDELRFRLPAGFENVEFVGRDVRRWVRQDDTWVVKLNRKVLGDYNLAVTYTQRYGPDRPIQLGALYCQDVQTQTGYVVVTSHLDLRLQLQADPGAGQAGLLPIALDELPGDYRLLTSSPILAAYKYVTEPHTALLSIDPYQRSGLLPVVVDIADLQTRLAIRPDGPIESVTTVRYKVKNTTGQFLALIMPAESRVWAVSLIEPRPDGGEQATRLAASHDPATGQLLVPLRRQANPNDPATIELEYGQVHKAGELVAASRGPGCTQMPGAYCLCGLAGHRSGPVDDQPDRREHAGPAQARDQTRSGQPDRPGGSVVGPGHGSMFQSARGVGDGCIMDRGLGGHPRHLPAEMGTRPGPVQPCWPASCGSEWRQAWVICPCLSP